MSSRDIIIVSLDFSGFSFVQRQGEGGVLFILSSRGQMCADSLYQITVSIIPNQFKYVHKYERVRKSSFFPSTIFQ